MAIGHPIVLYVEDEETDRILMQFAFEKAGLGAALRTVSHGQAAIDYLSGAGAYAHRAEYPLPALVLLDLNLPGLPGFLVLKWIREQQAHSALPVVVFTSSSREEDRRQAQMLGASDYLQKPGMPSGLQEVARQLHKKWLASAGSGVSLLS